jgi:hypothetical protein
MGESLKFQSSLDYSKFDAGLNHMKAKASTDSKSIGSSFAKFAGGAAGGVGLPLGFAAVGAAAIAVGKHVLDFSGNLQDMADSTGMAVESLQGLQYAFSQSGTKAENFKKGVTELQVNIAESLGGNE